jgi:hypothetical protein
MNTARNLFDRPVETQAEPFKLAVAPFDGWILRPDVSGRMAWESPDVPKAARWWARSTFEELPTIGDG